MEYRIEHGKPTNCSFKTEDENMKFLLFNPSISKVTSEKFADSSRPQPTLERDLVAPKNHETVKSLPVETVDQFRNVFANVLTAVLTTCLVGAFVWLSVWTISSVLTEFSQLNLQDLFNRFKGSSGG